MYANHEYCTLKQHVQVKVFARPTKLVLVWFDAVFQALQNGIKVWRKKHWPAETVLGILAFIGVYRDF